MAYFKHTNEEHAFRTFSSMLRGAEKSDEWAKVILLTGKEEFLVDWAERELKKRLVDPSSAAFDLSVFSEDALDVPELISACETLPVISAKKVVIVKHCDFLSSTKPASVNAEELQKLTEYVQNLPDSAVLIIVSPKVDKRLAFYKALSKAGLVYEFKPLEDRDLAAWMGKQLGKSGRSASERDLISYAHAAGYGDPERSYSLYDLENDLKKALALCDKKYLGSEDLFLAGGGEPETAAFTILDSAFSGQTGRALTVLNNSIASRRASQGTGVVLSFLGLLCSQLEIMLEAAERKEEGQSQREIEGEMKINPYRLRKAQRASAGRSVESLRKDLFNAFQIEKDMKSGLMDARLDLELFIAGL